jgi:mannose-1-phosphate guanylyltransferase
MVYTVIMAGGIGSRFWPESRIARPKQFLNVVGEATLLQNTLSRMQGLVPAERCYVVTHERYVTQTHEQLPALPPDNIFAEPVGRNTAPAIAFAAARLLEQDPDATMIVLPADHLIRNVAQFHAVLRVALEKAEEPGALVTIGITPTHPSTGYGYVQVNHGGDLDDEVLRAYPVRTFAEKPNVATAERFLDSGDFLWNSGMFIWRADSILAQMQTHLPDAYDAFAPLHQQHDFSDEAVQEAYQNSPRISIDYGVMERARQVYLVPGSFGWSDVGDWRAVYDLSEKDGLGNALRNQVIMHDASRCLVRASDRLIVVVGIHDTVVVDTEDAVLICHRDSTQQVKNVVEYLHAHQLDEYA